MFVSELLAIYEHTKREKEVIKGLGGRMPLLMRRPLDYPPVEPEEDPQGGPLEEEVELSPKPTRGAAMLFNDVPHALEDSKVEPGPTSCDPQTT